MEKNIILDRKLTAIKDLLKSASVSERIIERTSKKIEEIVTNFLQNPTPQQEEEINDQISTEIILSISSFNADIEQFIPKIPTFKFDEFSNILHNENFVAYIDEINKYGDDTLLTTKFSDILNQAKFKKWEDDKNQYKKDARTAFGVKRSKNYTLNFLKMFDNLNYVIESQNQTILSKQGTKY